MFSNVVVGMKDLEASRDALCLALALTSATGKLTFAHVQVVAPKPAPDSGAAGSAAKRRDALEELAARRDESQLDAELVYAEARSVREGLHDAARAGHADLLVIGASRYDVIYRDLVGDNTRQVLEDAPCAVAVAPLGYSDQRRPARAIGVAYDDSSDAARVLALAKKLAVEWHAKLSVFQAVSGLHLNDPGHFQQSTEDEATQARARIAELAGVEAHAEYGDPAQELGRYGQSVDLLVLGAHRHGPIRRMLGQGTVQRLADAPPCPLLVLPQARRLSISERRAR